MNHRYYIGSVKISILKEILVSKIEIKEIKYRYVKPNNILMKTIY